MSIISVKLNGFDFIYSSVSLSSIAFANWASVKAKKKFDK